MFYSKFMFVKKGPLSKVWIAAHFHRKLTKSLVQGTDVNLSAKSILDPTTPLALRLSGQLLLGLVRIYQKKVKYLQEDCSDALTKMKMMFRPGAVDLPPDASVAPSAQITHEDNFEMIEYAISDIPLDNLDDMGFAHPEVVMESSLDGGRLEAISAHAPDITMEEPSIDLGNIDLLGDDLLGEGFDNMQLDQLGEDTMLGDDTLEMGRAQVSDVEMGRDAVLENHEFDIELTGKDETLLAGLESDKDRSLMAAELSGLDTTTDMELGLVDESQISQSVVAQRKRPSRKRKQAKRDVATELSSRVIAEAIKDSSDIMLPEGRSTVPFTKRAKLRAELSEIPHLMELPCTREGSSFAPELLQALQRTAQLAQAPEQPHEEAEGEEEEKLLEEPAEEDQFVFQDDNLDLNMSLMEETAVLGQEEEKHGVYDDDLDHDRQQLDDFFGESQGSAKDADEEEMVGWSHRTKKMQQLLAKEMKGKKSIQLEDLVEGRNRKVAAGAFYQLLVLKSHSIVDVQQPEAYGMIEISELTISRSHSK